ncbi:hypothetical protein [Streptomyces mirabilis]|uniref:hypothetical protein n=1 Tax=Streptomyces mirabilis TaxID=68239 RepID=UPI00343CADC0
MSGIAPAHDDSGSEQLHGGVDQGGTAWGSATTLAPASASRSAMPTPTSVGSGTM